MGRSAAKPITITDVARHAGVSLSTVSRVMNGNPTVDPALAERVRDSATRLGYSASPVARSLVLGRTQTIAIVLPDLGNPTFQAILRGLSRAASEDGYRVLIADSAESVGDERVLATELRARTDGIVLCAPRMTQDDLAALLPDIQPAVLVNREPYFGTPVVSADYGSALLGLIEHLYGLGHRRLVYLAGVTASTSNAARLRALAEARTRHADLTIDELGCGVDFDSGAASAAAVAASGATAVLAYNDLVAMGLISALGERGVRVPGDLSVVGFDDIPFARFMTPPLTTATVPATEMGALAWQAMRARLDGTAQESVTVLEPSLAVRASAAAV